MKVRKKIYSEPRKSLLQKKDNLMQIKAKDEANLTNDSDILRECNSFYLDLYTTKSTKNIKTFGKNLFLAVNTTNSTKWIRKNARVSLLKNNV